MFQSAPTLGAPSFKTTSAFKCFIWFFILFKQSLVVISSYIDIQFGTVYIGSKSIPIIIDEDGMNLDATYIQPPGAAHKSINTLADYKKLYF